MKTYNIFTNQEDSLPLGKADFLLAASVTKTSNKTSLIPTLDSEFITNEKVFSSPTLENIHDGVPSPAIITRAIHNVSPFSCIEILDLGLEIKPMHTTVHNFDISPSESIASGANIDAEDIFAKGMKFGKTYELRGNYLILGESVPGGETTAIASCLALNKNSENDIRFSFFNSPTSLQDQTMQDTLSLTDENMSNFEKLSVASDNMLIFCAGFLLEASRRFHIVLAGGIQMAACLLIADKLKEDVLMRLKSENITLATTSWAVNHQNSHIKHLLSLLSYTPHAICTEFNFTHSEIVTLRKYDEGKIRDSIGAGASLAYGSANDLSEQKILDSIELVIYMM